MTMSNQELQELFIDILNISSRTFHEQEIALWVSDWIKESVPGVVIKEEQDSYIFHIEDSSKEEKPHICLVGHFDTVPDFFEARVDQDKIHGSGASDMKGALPVYMSIFKEYAQQKNVPYKLSLIFYAREENTKIHENGLNTLVNKYLDFLQSIDLAIIGEPTDKTIQVGCVGSIHATVSFNGVAAHSARPWTGENALYKAVDFIQFFKNMKRIRQTVFGVDFYDVMTITKSKSVTPSGTTVPALWQCNVNYRFSPLQTLVQAEKVLIETFVKAGAEKDNCFIENAVYAGKVIETELFSKVVKEISLPVSAKQAWTDVAQFGEIGVPSFNYGPGLTAQAHCADEYILKSDLYDYYERLKTLFL